jgi:hypothetical protein
MAAAKKKTAVGKKISKLVSEGKTQKAAVGAALGMKAEGRLGPEGGYKKKKSPHHAD